ncbi:hypothetical protein WI81_02405 [Burkholderia ubonensis]|uniref:hypothetical protein n=1 Tax=Burkholderia ubonensis TaxID=101571 RepID=UPI0007590141|nr:hypothetical protein [Burkholderia ubonensis]KVD23142.1 hypothetical protein WI81_02405 [Burkholderia ubonensis]
MEILPKAALTGACRFTEYWFKKGSAEFVVDNDPSCTESAPPKDATDNPWMYINGDMKLHCYCTH